jgi:hypothetical protein
MWIVWCHGGSRFKIETLFFKKWFRETAFCRFGIVPINVGYQACNFPKEIWNDFMIIIMK